ncbi:hypothetical protein [Pararhizobium sp. A13]|uniref:hypothetical protein n=1 Tax=Pararhizobium sp. A13 TaxID=3133975 RepID=UPI0032DB9275
MRIPIVAALIFSVPFIASAEGKRRFVRDEYFMCAALHFGLRDAYKEMGAKAASDRHSKKAEILYEAGKKDLVEVGKSPSEAKERVQKHLDRMTKDLETRPELFPAFIRVCNESFPE